MNTVGTYRIQGREIVLPVEVREAASWAAVFSVPARAAQTIVDPTGLRVVHARPGRTLVTLVFADYVDGDLDAYHEFGVSFLVHPHDGGGSLDLIRNRARVYIHHLPVDQGFTLQAGREIWGYPKFLADISIEPGVRETTSRLAQDGREVVSLSVRDRGTFPMPPQSPATYTFLDGVLRLTEWETEAGGRGRLGGARLSLGEGPIADELRSMGLPKRALFTLTLPKFRARFGAAEAVTAAQP